MLLVSISLVTPEAAVEFNPRYPTLLSAALYAGLVIGALSVGELAVIMGRMRLWQVSIFGVAVFSMIAASSPNWTALNIFVALTGIFGGGNRKWTSHVHRLQARMEHAKGPGIG
jgi:MFS family permease